MKINKITYLSFILSLIAIGYLLVINYQIAQKYIVATGKTRALFGLIELNYCIDKCVIAGLTIFAFIVSVISIKKYYSNFALILIVFNVITFVLIFFPLWSLLAN